MMALRRILAAACGLLVVGLHVPLSAGEPKDPKTVSLEKRLEELRHERVAVGERAVEAMQAAFDAETITLFDLLGAVNKLAEARLAVAKTPAQKIDALQKRLKHLQQVEQKVAALYEISTRGGEVKEYAAVTRERLSAQIELIEAMLEQNP